MDADQATFARLSKYSVGFYGVWLIHVGRQFGLLQRISESPVSIDQLIYETKLYGPAVQAWCSAAIAYDIIENNKNKIILKPEIKGILLDKENPLFLGGQFSYLALRSLEYEGLKDLFKSGKIKQLTSFEAIDYATDWDHYAFLRAIKRQKRIDRGLKKGSKILDVGCGTGNLLVKMKSVYPASDFVGIDPSSKAVARAPKSIKGIKIIRQSGEKMNFVNEFDLIYLGESLYAMKDKQKVVSNCYRALKNRGTIAIVEGLLMDLKSQNDQDKLIMGMQLDFALEGLQFLKKSEIITLLDQFHDVKFKPLGGSVYLVTAVK